MSQNNIPNDIKSYLRVGNQIQTTEKSLSYSCYDDFYCNSPEAAFWGHLIIGIFGLLLTLVAIVLNVMLLPVLRLVGIRSSATCYMIGMIISDLCHLFINLLLSVIRYLPSSNEIPQLIMYKTFIAYFVPLGYPLKYLCQSLSLTFCICLVLDRLVYTRKESSSNCQIKRSLSIKVIIGISIFTIIIKLPNFLLMKIVENLKEGSISISWTSLANSWIFAIDISLFVLFYLLLILSESLLIILSVENKTLPKLNIKRRFQCAIEERYKRRERIYVLLAVVIGLTTIVFKLPHIIRLFIHGMNPTEYRDTSIRLSNLLISDMFMDMTDIALICLKPVLYLCFAVHFRKSLKDMIGLWIRPKFYSQISVAGGIGKTVTILTSSELKRIDTSQSLLKNKSIIGDNVIEILAKSHKNNTNNNLGSSTSFTSTSGNEESSSHSLTGNNESEINLLKFSVK